MFGRWNTPLAIVTFLIGFLLAGRRAKWLMLAGLGCLLVFIFGTNTGVDGWELTAWSWLSMGGMIVDLCCFPWAWRRDKRDRIEHRVEADVQREEYRIAVHEEAEERYEEDTRRLHEPTGPRFEYETDDGVVVRDFRAVDPDEL